MTVYPADPTARAGILLVLAHGAGAGESHPFMVRYARGLASRGLDVVTFNFPYMEAKRHSPDKAPVLEDAFRRAIVDAVTKTHFGTGRLLIGGKSMGGRMATHLAAAPDSWPKDAPPLAGVIALGYPLKAGRQDRVSHLLKIQVPTLIVQGTRDSFGGPEDVRAALAGRARAMDIHSVDGGDHSFAVPKSKGSQADVDNAVCDHITAWTRRRMANGA